MKIKYQTGIATLVQFIAISLLSFGDSANSVITTCHSSKGDCVSNLIVTLIFTILLVMWFCFIWILGLAAQHKRSKRLSQLLILAEVAIILIATFNAKHHTDILSLATSLTDVVLGFWVIFLAFRLMRSDGGRVVTSTGRRRRIASKP